MENKKIAVYGILKTEAEAEALASDLKSSGFRVSDISALLPAGDRTKEFAHTNSTKSPEGAAVGGVSGAVLGGTLGLLAGIGSLAVPGVGPFIAAGPIFAALGGASVGGAVGALTGALVGLGIPEYEAKRYEGRIKDGGILVSVHCDDHKWKKKAKELFENHDAEDVSSSSEEAADTKADPRSGHSANY